MSLNVKKLIAPNILEIYELNEILDIINSELGNFSDEIQDFLNQFFIETATWGISVWEDMLGVASNEEYSIETRRSACIAKIRGRGVFNIDYVQKLASSFANGETNVTEDKINGVFTVQFISIRGVPEGIDVFKKLLLSLKPAHLQINYGYNFVTWGEVKPFTWQNCKEVDCWNTVLNTPLGDEDIENIFDLYYEDSEGNYSLIQFDD